MSLLNKLSWKLGFSEESKTVLSDIKYATVKVSKEKFVMGDSNLFYINYSGYFNKDLNFRLNSHLNVYLNLVSDQVALIGYREVNSVISDYISPNFETKEEIKTIFEKNTFVSIETSSFKYDVNGFNIIKKDSEKSSIIPSFIQSNGSDSPNEFEDRTCVPYLVDDFRN